LRCLLDRVSLLIHTRSEKFEAVDATWTGDLIIVTELREDGVQIVLFAHLLRWERLEALDGSVLSAYSWTCPEASITL